MMDVATVGHIPVVGRRWVWSVPVGGGHTGGESGGRCVPSEPDPPLSTFLIHRSQVHERQ